MMTVKIRQLQDNQILITELTQQEQFYSTMPYHFRVSWGKDKCQIPDKLS